MPKSRTIRIDHITLPNKEAHYREQKLYRIYLGNDKQAQLQSLRHAKMFLAETNRFLNEILEQILAAIAEVANELVLNFKTLQGREFRSFTVDIQDIAKALNLAIDRSGLTNGNQFVWSHFRYSCDSLASMITRLEKKIQPEASLNRKLQAALVRINWILERLSDYPDFRDMMYLNKKTNSTIVIKPAKM